MTTRSMYVFNGSTWDEVGYTIAHDVPAGGATGTVLSKSSATDYDAAWVAQSALTVAQSQVTNLTTDLSAKAPLASPTFTGVPAAPTAAVDTSTTQIATTAFTVAQIADDAVLKTVADAAGDLVVGSAADTFGRLALGTDNHVLTVDTAGSGVAKVGWEDPTANPLTTAAMAAKVNTATVGNLLTANQASVETSIDWWTNLGARDAGDAAHGAASILFTMPSAAASYMQGGYGTSGIPVTAGQTYTAYYVTKNVVGTRTTTPEIEWYNDSSYLSVSTGTAITPSSSEWSVTRLTAVAPANATRASQIVRVGAGSTSDQMRVDKLGFWEGAGGQWALPGTPITNLGFYTDESVGRRLFQWDANNSRFQQTYGDTGWRNVTSLVTPPADLTITTIYVRRINSTVYVRVKSQAAAGIAATVWSWSTIGTGFTPVDIASQLFYYYRSFTDAQRQLWYRDTITADIGTSAANPSPLDVSWIHVTSDAWPTTLPGSAVGSIPA